MHELGLFIRIRQIVARGYPVYLEYPARNGIPDPFLIGFLTHVLYELVRILIRSKGYDSLDHIMISQDLYGSHQSLSSRFVIIVGQIYFAGISLDKSGLSFRKCGTQGCYGIVEARLMLGYNVHIPFAEYDSASSGLSGYIHGEEISALTKDIRLLCIYILRKSVSQNSSAECDYLIVYISYRYYDSVPEYIMYAASLIYFHQSRVSEDFLREPFGLQEFIQIVTVNVRVSEAELHYCLIRVASLPVILISVTSSFCLGQKVMEVCRCHLVGFKYCLLLAYLCFLGRGKFFLRKSYSRSLGQELYGFLKCKVFVFHYEGIYISSGSASEAVIHLLLFAYRKGRRLLVMKRAAAFI